MAVLDPSPDYSNHNVNCVMVNGLSIIDLTNDTVTAETLAEGVTAHDKTGAKITGTARVTKTFQYGKQSGGVITIDTSGFDEHTTLMLAKAPDGVALLYAEKSTEDTWVCQDYNSSEIKTHYATVDTETSTLQWVVSSDLSIGDYTGTFWLVVCLGIGVQT